MGDGFWGVGAGLRVGGAPGAPLGEFGPKPRGLQGAVPRWVPSSRSSLFLDVGWGGGHSPSPLLNAVLTRKGAVGPGGGLNKPVLFFFSLSVCGFCLGAMLWGLGWCPPNPSRGSGAALRPWGHDDRAAGGAGARRQRKHHKHHKHSGKRHFGVFSLLLLL